MTVAIVVWLNRCQLSLNVRIFFIGLQELSVWLQDEKDQLSLINGFKGLDLQDILVARCRYNLLFIEVDADLFNFRWHACPVESQSAVYFIGKL